jgi:hypothetical protein
MMSAAYLRYIMRDPSTQTYKRGVAQPGSAPPWGGGGRRFKSSRPDQHLVSQLIKILLLRSHPVVTDGITFYTRMAHPSPARLWASARRGADRDVCACPAATGCRVGAARDPKPRRRGSLCAIRAAFSFVHFFWPNKRNGPRVQGRSHPQLGFDIARKARDIIQGLDSRFRGNDNNVAGCEACRIHINAAEGDSK